MTQSNSQRLLKPYRVRMAADRRKAPGLLAGSGLAPFAGSSASAFSHWLKSETEMAARLTQAFSPTRRAPAGARTAIEQPCDGPAANAPPLVSRFRGRKAKSSRLQTASDVADVAPTAESSTVESTADNPKIAGSTPAPLHRKVRVHGSSASLRRRVWRRSGRVLTDVKRTETDRPAPRPAQRWAGLASGNSPLGLCFDTDRFIHGQTSGARR